MPNTSSPPPPARRSANRRLRSLSSLAGQYDTSHLLDFQQVLSETVRDLQESVQELALTLRAVQTQMPTRESIEREIDKRLDRDTYKVAHEALENEMRERAKALGEDIGATQTELTRFREKVDNSWQRAAPWVAIAVTGLGNFVTFCIGVAAIVISLTHH